MKSRIFKLTLSILLSFTFMFVCSAASTGSKLIEDPNTNIVNYGDYADSKYSFGFHVNSESVIIPGNLQDFDLQYYELTNDKITFVPNGMEGSGKAYIIIKNVGNYHGKTLDLKLTYSWKDVNINNRHIFPVIALELFRNDGGISPQFLTTAYDIRYDILSDGKPVNVNMSMLLADIDFAQYYGLKLNDGRLNKIETVEGSEVYHLKTGDYDFIYDGINVDSNSSYGVEYERQHTARFELEGVSSFNFIMGPGDDFISYSDIFTAPIIGTESLYPPNDIITEDIAKNNIVENNDKFFAREVTLGGAAIASSAYGPYSPTKPIIFVSDNDEKLKDFDVIDKLDEEIIYDIFVSVPQENPEFYYTKYDIVDEIPEDLVVSSVHIYDEAGDIVDDKFTIIIDDNKYTISAKASTLSNGSFYNKTYDVRFKTNLTNATKEKVENGNRFAVENSSYVISKRTSESDKVNSNTVLTRYKAFNISTEAVNGEIDGSVDVAYFGDDVTINYKPNKGYIISKLIIDGEEVEINDNSTSYTFKSIDKDHSIKVIFEIENVNTGASVSFILLGVGLITGTGAIIYTKKKKKLFNI